ncbi:MAG: pyridoxamine 5'-phosphate oxidase family protein [Verrucomicrobiae bacterium]|nr:pyridoxamine 5'-phosphate oxidase family protein [Verrucomicrobiae bacterium]
MPAPSHTPIPPAELTALAREVMRNARFPLLATQDGNQPRLRPVSPVRVEGFTVHVANLRVYHKTIELAANPRCELCYVNERHDQVRLTGVAEIERDTALLREIWESNPLLRAYLGTPDNPDLIVYRITPNRVRYMKEWALEYYEVPIGKG